VLSGGSPGHRRQVRSLVTLGIRGREVRGRRKGRVVCLCVIEIGGGDRKPQENLELYSRLQRDVTYLIIMDDDSITIPPPPPSPSNTFNGYVSSTPISPPLMLQLSSMPSVMVTPSKRAKRARALTVQAPRCKTACSNAPEIELADGVDEDVFTMHEIKDIGSGPTDIMSPKTNSLATSLLSTEYDNNYDHYVDAALADCAGFVQISTSFFVAQGWESRSATTTVSTGNIYFNGE
jgi:hypothetical protein